MTESIQILLCPHCGETNVTGIVDIATAQIHSCERCVDEDPQTAEHRKTFEDGFLQGFKFGVHLKLPEGHQIVPVKPTGDMVKATYPLVLRSSETIYDAMLKAAPSFNLDDEEADA